MRTCYSIHLTSPNAVNQSVAKTGLSQMLSAVFERMEKHFAEKEEAGEDTDSEYTDDEDVEKGAFCGGPGGADGAANPVGDCGAGSRKGASSVFSW